MSAVEIERRRRFWEGALETALPEMTVEGYYQFLRENGLEHRDYSIGHPMSQDEVEATERHLEEVRQRRRRDA